MKSLIVHLVVSSNSGVGQGHIRRHGGDLHDAEDICVMPELSLDARVVVL